MVRPPATRSLPRESTGRPFQSRPRPRAAIPIPPRGPWGPQGLWDNLHALLAPTCLVCRGSEFRIVDHPRVSLQPSLEKRACLLACLLACLPKGPGGPRGPWGGLGSPRGPWGALVALGP